jgi:hypothetical protein
MDNYGYVGGTGCDGPCGKRIYVRVGSAAVLTRILKGPLVSKPRFTLGQLLKRCGLQRVGLGISNKGLIRKFISQQERSSLSWIIYSKLPESWRSFNNPSVEAAQKPLTIIVTCATFETNQDVIRQDKKISLWVLESSPSVLDIWIRWDFLKFLSITPEDERVGWISWIDSQPAGSG